MFNPRPMQAEVLKYTSGWMGVSAVPGSGKTHTLSYLAAQLIMNANLRDDQEILIVTLVNSAVDNFSTRISSFIQEKGLLPNIGYRVRTLHGLAHDIVRERPEIAGLSERFTIVDEAETERMIEEITFAYLRTHPEIEETYIDPGYYPLDNQNRKVWNNQLISVNTSFISQAKDWEMDPETILQRAREYQFSEPIFEMALEVYSHYQRGLRARSAVDFADLIRLAYRILKSDPEFLTHLQYRWPYVLEDEAQDSSQIQEKILRILVGSRGNWVRVGDPNQAIYESFTTASPKYLINFLAEKNVQRRDLANSGRSTRQIIHLANDLIDWTRRSHPVPDLRNSLTTPYILPTDPGDPQPNPSDADSLIYIYKSKLTSDQEIGKVVDSIKKWLPDHQGKTVAVLCPIGAHGDKVVAKLQAAGIKVVEKLKSSEGTRATCRLLEKGLASLADPSSQAKLAAAFFEIYSRQAETDAEKEVVSSLQAAIKGCANLEDFLYPTPGKDWKDAISIKIPDEDKFTLLDRFREMIKRWHKAALLPIDQLILTMAQDLFTASQDLALAHKIALLLEFNSKIHPENQLADFADELADIANNHRKFLGFSDEDTGFNPEDHKGEVLVSTYHKAKGLEWDRVYLLSVNSYDFPSGDNSEEYIGEKKFVRGKLNLQSECLAKLKAIADEKPSELQIEPGIATEKDRITYSSERLQLFYVGITRARENLIITWNTGRRGDSRIAVALEALNSILEVEK